VIRVIYIALTYCTEKHRSCVSC